jgi:hypothetical protein
VRNRADFLTCDLRRFAVWNTVANELFTTGSGTKTRRCKLLIWRVLQDSRFRKRGVAEIPNELETAGRSQFANWRALQDSNLRPPGS